MRNTLVYSNNLNVELPDGRVILDDISFSVLRKDRIGLVGRNGSGKSTLLKAIYDAWANSRKDISFSTSIPVGYLPQIDLEMYKNEYKLYEFFGSRGNEFWWDILSKVKHIFGSEIDHETKLADLSGGEITKILFAEVLSDYPSLLLLDEPTNHLDENTTERLLSFLKEFNGAVVFASHNINFLNSLAEQIWELEDGHLRVFPGNYDDYQKLKSSEIENKNRIYREKLSEAKKLRSYISKKQSEVKNMDDKFTSRNPYMRKKSGKKAKTAKILLGKYDESLQDLNENFKSKEYKKAYLDLQTDSKKGRLFQLKDFSIKVGTRTLIENINLSLSYGERIAITGDNGSGKTLLSRTILDNLDPDVKGMYLSQKYEIVDPNKTLLENIFWVNPDIGYEKCRKVLGNFLFVSEDDVNKKASVLSGGEIARLAMAMITAKPVDILILDEPTNHLDIYTVDIIIEALQEFHGGLVVISHDMNFINSIHIDKIYKILNKILS